MSTTIKERFGSRCLIREDNYGKTIEKINQLVAIAKADFPDLDDSKIEIVVYGGQRIKYIMGLEFNAPDTATIPDCYQTIAGLEPTLA